MSTKVTIGAQVSTYINGQLLGSVTSFKFSSSTPYKEQFGIDSLTPFEMTPTVCKVAGQVAVLRMVGDGGLEGQGMTTRFEQLMNQKYFTLTLRDTLTDAVLFECRYTVVNDQSWDFQPKDLVRGTFSFSGVTWQNEVQSAG